MRIQAEVVCSGCQQSHQGQTSGPCRTWPGRTDQTFKWHQSNHDSKGHSISNLSEPGLPVLALVFLQGARWRSWADWKLITFLATADWPITPAGAGEQLPAPGCCWGVERSCTVTPQVRSWSYPVHSFSPRDILPSAAQDWAWSQSSGLSGTEAAALSWRWQNQLGWGCCSPLPAHPSSHQGCDTRDAHVGFQLLV